jgi:hypothetical protein
MRKAEFWPALPADAMLSRAIVVAVTRAKDEQDV